MATEREVVDIGPRSDSIIVSRDLWWTHEPAQRPARGRRRQRRAHPAWRPQLSSCRRRHDLHIEAASHW